MGYALPCCCWPAYRPRRRWPCPGPGIGARARSSRFRLVLAESPILVLPVLRFCNMGMLRFCNMGGGAWPGGAARCWPGGGAGVWWLGSRGSTFWSVGTRAGEEVAMARTTADLEREQGRLSCVRDAAGGHGGLDEEIAALGAEIERRAASRRRRRRLAARARADACRSLGLVRTREGGWE